MAQGSWTPLNAGTDDGSTLATKLNDVIPALLSNQEGAAPPPNPIKGAIFADTSLADQVVFKYYNGSGWNNFLAINTKTGAVTVPGVSGGSGDGFPAGTRVMFQQAAAPTGWTKDTTHHNKALRVVNSGISSGGTVPFTDAFKVHAMTGTVQGHTLDWNQMPSHGHQSNSGNVAYANASNFFVYPVNGGGPNYVGYGAVVTENAGGNQPHDHPFVGSNVDLTVQYVDVIIGQKN